MSSLQPAFINRAAEEPGHALQSRYVQKWDKYGPKCEAEGMVFQPLPLEVLGGWHETGASLVKQIGQALARSSSQEENVVIKHLFQKLSVLLMRGTAQLVLNRMPQPNSQTLGFSPHSPQVH